MKMILAFIPPHRLDRVTRALEHLDGFPGMTVTASQGFGHEKLEESHDAREQLTDFTGTVRVESVVQDAMAEDVLGAIIAAAHTGTAGDGKIFVLPVDNAVRIKTKERGVHAV
jgi:nitrogen regulatory protein P-II 1